MSGVENLIQIHKQDMAVLRSDAKVAKSKRLDTLNDYDQSFKSLRSRIVAETPELHTAFTFFKAPAALMLTLLFIFAV